ncbi:MAG: VOC family protein [Nodosilinea sp.]
MHLKYLYTRLNVANYAACKAFYQDVLGFQIGFEDPLDQYVELATGVTKITIFDRQHLREFVGPSEELTYSPHRAGTALTFEVTDMDAALAELKQHGVKLIRSPAMFSDMGFVSACFRDPDGNLIELQHVADVSIH